MSLFGSSPVFAVRDVEGGGTKALRPDPPCQGVCLVIITANPDNATLAEDGQAGRQCCAHAGGHAQLLPDLITKTFRDQARVK